MANYLVTGANRGIGYEFCKQLTERGENVIGVCRQYTRDFEKLGIRIFSDLDLTCDRSIKKISDLIGSYEIDVLINNAGILEKNSLQDLDKESIISQFETNTVAPLLLTKALLPNLAAKAKIIFITSRMGSIEDNLSGSSYGYRMSKVALNMAAKSLSIDLRSKEISIALLHPGLVRTGIRRHQRTEISERLD